MSPDFKSLSAFPLSQGSDTTKGTQGMSQRTLIAAHAMQGLLANSDSFESCCRVHGANMHNATAEMAVKFADALLAQLSK